MDSQLESLDQVKASILDMAIRFGPKLMVAIVILVAGYMVGRWAGRVLERVLVRFKFEPPVRALLVRAGEILVIGLFAIMALQNLGVELLPLIAGLGVAGAGEVNKAILETFRARNIDMPFPQLEVRMLGGAG